VHEHTGHNPMIREYNRLKLINNMLYRITTFEDEERQQLVSMQASSYDEEVAMCTSGAL
jgi:hypothetical protein